MKITVLVSGGWGTALAMILYKNGHAVTLWSRRQEITDLLQRTRENPKLPGVTIPVGIALTSDLACLREAELVVMSAPSFAVRDVCRRAGILIGKGETPEQAMGDVGAVVEGYYAAKSVYALGRKMGVDMPITQEAYRILYEGKSAKDATADLLTREKRAELEDAGW